MWIIPPKSRSQQPLMTNQRFVFDIALLSLTILMVGTGCRRPTSHRTWKPNLAVNNLCTDANRWGIKSAVLHTSAIQTPQNPLWIPIAPAMRCRCSARLGYASHINDNEVGGLVHSFPMFININDALLAMLQDLRQQIPQKTAIYLTHKVRHLPPTASLLAPWLVQSWC